MSRQTKPGPGEASEGPRFESDRWVVMGWVSLIGWWIFAYVLTIDLHGWIFTELATLKAGSLSFTGMLANRATFGHCPLYFVLSWAIQQTLGENLIALRLPVAVFGLSCAVVVFRIVRLWAGSRAAVFAGLIVILSPFLLQVSQQARPYALALLFGLVATEIVLDTRGLTGRRRALLFALVSLLGLLTSHAYWFVLVAHVLVFLGNARRQRLMIAGAVAAVIGAMPWVLYAKFWAQSDGKSERFLTWMGPVELTTSLALPGRLVSAAPIEPDSSRVLILAMTIAAIALAGVGLAALPGSSTGSRSSSIRLTLGCLWIVPPLSALGAGLLGWGNLLLVPRYFAVTAVIQLVLIGWAIWTARSAIRPVAMIALCLCLAGASVFHLVEAGRDEIRGSARIIEAERAKGEAVVMVSLFSDLRLFKRYLNTPVIGCLIDDALIEDSEVSERHFPEYRGGRRGAWIVVSHRTESTRARGREGFFSIEAFLASLRTDYRSVETRTIGDIDLHHFTDRVPDEDRPVKEIDTTTGGEEPED